MANVIDLFPNPPDGDPMAFLEAVERSFVQGKPLTPYAPLVEGFLASVQREDWFRVLARACRILARIDWRPLAEKEQPSVQPAEISDDLQAMSEKVEDTFVAAFEAQEKLRVKATKRGLKHFSPAYAYLDAFDSLFGNESPVDYIEEALGILSPDEPYAHPDDCWFADDDRRTLDSTQLAFFVEDLLVPLMALIATTDKPAQELSEEDKRRQLGRMLLMVPAIGLPQLFTGKLSEFELTKFEFPNFADDPVDSSLTSLLQQIDSAAGFLALMLRPGLFPLPQGLLVALIRRFLDDEYETGEELGGRIGLHLMNWPLGVPQTSWEEIESGLIYPEWVGELQAQYSSPEEAPFLPCRMLATWLYPLYDNAAALSFSLGQQIYTRMLAIYSEKLDRLSVSTLGRRFPWPASSPGNWYYHGVGGEPSDSWNLLLLLTVANEDEGIGYYCPFGDDPGEPLSSFHIFVCLWTAANRGGFPKLGNALFSFYLIRKLSFSSDNESPPEFAAEPLRAQIDLCLRHPGREWVMRSLGICRQTCKEKGWQIDWLLLDSLVDEDNAVPTNTSAALARTDDPIVELGHEKERQLADDYGPQWFRLSDRVRRMLSHAEANFEKIAPDLGRRKREYKGPVIDYAICFEIELESRLKGLFLKPDVQKFLKENVRGFRTNHTEPTLGSYLMLLDNFHGMPPELKERVTGCVGSLAEDSDLRQQLRKLKKDYRDKAAHSNPTPATDVTRVRELIFSEGLLGSFLAALPDRPEKSES